MAEPLGQTMIRNSSFLLVCQLGKINTGRYSQLYRKHFLLAQADPGAMKTMFSFGKVPWRTDKYAAGPDMCEMNDYNPEPGRKDKQERLGVRN